MSRNLPDAGQDIVSCVFAIRLWDLLIAHVPVSVHLIEALANPHEFAGRYVEHVMNVFELLLQKTGQHRNKDLFAQLVNLFCVHASSVHLRRFQSYAPKYRARRCSLYFAQTVAWVFGDISVSIGCVKIARNLLHAFL